MKKYSIFMFAVLVSAFSNGEESLETIGSFESVKATDTGHCYGTTLSIWKTTDNKLIGLLDIHQGLCGDPPCSLIEGTINNEEVSFTTSSPIYNVLYKFNGHIKNNVLIGELNDSKVSFQSSQFILEHKNVSGWCQTWKNVQRCSGVKEFCK